VGLIEFNSYSFAYLGRTEKALRNFSLKIERGTAVGLLGSAGAGKSTVIRAMGGLVPVEIPGIAEGIVLVDGNDASKLSPYFLAQKVGVVLDRPATQLLALTVYDDVAFGPANLGLDEKEIRERVEFALSVTRLKGFEQRNPEELSGGQQQSLAIAGILAMKPEVLALDEPVSMLDSEGKDRVLSILKSLVEQKNATLVITESGLDLESVVKYLDRLVVLEKGEVVLDGTPREVLASAVLDRAGVGRPQVTELFLKMRTRMSVPEIPCTLEEATQAMKRLLDNREIEAARRDRPELPPVDPIVVIKNLEHVYPPNVKALRGVDVEISDGRVTGLIGQNGSGKTTLCLHLVGVLKPTNQNALVKVVDVEAPKARIREIIRRANYVFQNPDNQLFQQNITAELSYGPKMLGLPPEEVKRRVEEMISELELGEYVNYDMLELPRDIKTIVAIGSVLVLQPKVLVLDEPTSAMDKKKTKWFIALLKRLNGRGLTILIVSHNMELIASLCDEVVVMTDGEVIAEGTAREVFSQAETLGRAKVRPPQITQLSQSLGEFGVPGDILTPDELLEFAFPPTTKGGR